VLYVIFFASCELESEPEEMVVKRTRKSEGTAATSARVRGQGQRVRGSEVVVRSERGRTWELTHLELCEL
jgi:hypothetical protein